jgi:hypothetical protein
MGGLKLPLVRSPLNILPVDPDDPVSVCNRGKVFGRGGGGCLDGGGTLNIHFKKGVEEVGEETAYMN